jgi:hypothetical protein
MNKTLNISGLIDSIANENEQKAVQSKTIGITKIASRLKGEFVDKTADDLTKVAEEIAEDMGVESLPLSKELEKVASEMEAASSTDEIIKIAKSLGNSDLSYISKIASSLADAIVEDLEHRLSEK